MTNQDSLAEGANRGNQASQLVRVTQTDLPLSCPMPGHPVVFLHPRVYLPIEATGMAVCPYCSTRYQRIGE